MKYIIFLLSFLVFPTIVSAANYPLEIINIKPAGTGSPAIGENNRIFRAYPGIEYNIRVAVIGGAYPFTFSLDNEPEGMIINENTGEIIWPSPASNADNIQLTVTGQENTTVNTSWSIKVTTDGFIFVDAVNGNGDGDGSVNNPYKTIQNLLDLGTTETDIFYFKNGIYDLPIYHPDYGADLGCRLTSGVAGYVSRMWLEYPGDNAMIDMNDHYIEMYGRTSASYFDGLEFVNMDNWGIRADTIFNYSTFRRNIIHDLTSSRETNGNQGFYYTGAGDIGYYLVFQDNEFYDFYGATTIGSLYDNSHFLIEDNYFHNLYGTGGPIKVALAMKTNLSEMFIRHNHIESMSEDPLYALIGSGLNSAMSKNSNHLEFSFNFFNTNAVNATAHRFNNNGPENPQLITWYYRNTVVGKIQLTNLDGSNDGSNCGGGPFIFGNNIIINNFADTDGVEYHYTCSNNPENCVVFNNNILATDEEMVIDENGNLTGDYLQYLGTHGWQVPDTDGGLLRIIHANVNQDSQINTTDAMLVLRNSLDLDMAETAWTSSATTGDVNCDNNSNSTDAMLILRYSLGLSVSGTEWCE